MNSKKKLLQLANHIIKRSMTSKNPSSPIISLDKFAWRQFLDPDNISEAKRKCINVDGYTSIPDKICIKKVEFVTNLHNVCVHCLLHHQSNEMTDLSFFSMYGDSKLEDWRKFDFYRSTGRKRSPNGESKVILRSTSITLFWGRSKMLQQKGSIQSYPPPLLGGHVCDT